MSFKTQWLAQCLVVSVLALPGLADDQIVGEWELTMDFGGSDLFATLTVTQQDDGSYAGRWGTNDVSDVAFDGETLTFSREASFGGNAFTMNFSAALKDGRLEGTVGNDQVELPVTGVRMDRNSPALGLWDVSFRIGERDVTARLSVTNGEDGQLAAEWIADFGEHTVHSVVFEESKLTVERTVKLQDQEFEVTYVAEVDGDTLTGTLTSSGGEIPARGKRFGSELIGAWELTATTDEGSRTRILTVYPDLTGRYDFLLAEIPVEITFEDGQVTFHGEVGFGNRTQGTDFTGTLAEGSLTGELVTPRGTSLVVGKRLGDESSVDN